MNQENAATSGGPNSGNPTPKKCIPDASLKKIKNEVPV
jgi:hypothetical protein